jgi:sensor histidine kinase regulating citrate/malate metabolism
VKTVMNLMLMLMLVLACSMSAMAQTDTSSDSMKKDNMSGKTMSMTGCVAEKDGKYMMMNKEHPDGVQLMSSEDMKAHVGHKMKVTGTMDKMDSMSGDSMKSDDKMSGDDKMKHDDMGKMGMKVSSMKMMSDQCDMSKMMNK